MPRLDPKIAVHHLLVKKGARPIKQGQRTFRPELILLIEEEVNKLIEVDFHLRGEVSHVDFQHCPYKKEEWANSNATTGHEDLSFIDGSSGYNQIRMAPVDEELTAFRTPKGYIAIKLRLLG
ncbi:UNVERIFIED_CONTAM: hypothetical protein Scaly_2841500 [Sesamum calycinum]|uniref:Uncharacterized protein n=1 Tax=Sesamum calycinum TaxID=2727403 RepID=A0AAW2IQR1_9LAMI